MDSKEIVYFKKCMFNENPKTTTQYNTYLSTIKPSYTLTGMANPRCIAGCTLFHVVLYENSLVPIGSNLVLFRP